MENKQNDELYLSNLERINESFRRGDYGKYNIIVDNNNFVNVTKICDDYDKNFSDWRKLKSSQDLIRIVYKSVNLSKNKLFLHIKGDDFRTAGSYIHPKLLPHVLLWIDPDFALTVSNIMNVNIEEKKHDDIDYEIIIKDWFDNNLSLCHRTELP
jgi:hypothetical protein